MTTEAAAGPATLATLAEGHNENKHGFPESRPRGSRLGRAVPALLRALCHFCVTLRRAASTVTARNPLQCLFWERTKGAARSSATSAAAVKTRSHA